MKARSAIAVLAMLLGAFDTAVMISDKVIAGYAVRQGARLGAELGGSLTNPTLTTGQVDANIIQNVRAVAVAMNYSSLTEIDIYSPTHANGIFDPTTDQYDKFDGSGNPISYGFPLSNRLQVPPSEGSIGVRLVWRYIPPTGFATFSISLDEHAVMKLAPVLP